MKKLFVVILVGLVAALFGAQSCSEAKVISNSKYTIEYDETSIYLISKETNSLEFNVLQRYNGGEWVTAHYHQIPYDGTFVKVSINNMPYRSYHIWNDSCGAVYRSVWKIVYGYGFS